MTGCHVGHINTLFLTFCEIIFFIYFLYTMLSQPAPSLVCFHLTCIFNMQWYFKCSNFPILDFCLFVCFCFFGILDFDSFDSLKTTGNMVREVGVTFNVTWLMDICRKCTWGPLWTSCNVDLDRPLHWRTQQQETESCSVWFVWIQGPDSFKHFHFPFSEFMFKDCHCHYLARYYNKLRHVTTLHPSPLKFMIW